MPKYKILIADDHAAVREGVKAILAPLHNVSCDDCGSIEQLHSRVATGLRPDLYILDIAFPGADVLDLLSYIQKQHPEASILIYSCHEEPWLLARLTGEQIRGYVSKNAPAVNLREAVTAIREGRTAFDETFTRICEEANSKLSSPDELSLRELQVLEYMTQGLSTNKIAEKMHLSPFTVKTYRGRLARKLHAVNAVDIVVKGKTFLLKGSSYLPKDSE